MGDKAEYRWDRRRAKTRTGPRAAAQSLFGFQLILLILAFFLFAVGTRIILMFALTTSPCIEAAAHFGASNAGPTTFERLRAISLTAMVFWVVVTLAHWRALNSLLKIAFQAALLSSFFVAQAIFFHMTLDNAQPPDGYLAVNSPVLSVVDGISVYNPHMARPPEYDRWISGGQTPPENFEKEWSGNLQCVWLDENMVSDLGMLRDDSYASMTLQQRFQGSIEFRLRNFPEWTLRGLLRDSFKFMRTDTSMFETLLQTQTYRPLTNSEQLRFTTKQACLSSNFTTKRIEVCSYQRHFDSDSFWEDYSENLKGLSYD